MSIKGLNHSEKASVQDFTENLNSFLSKNRQQKDPVMKKVAEELKISAEKLGELSRGKLKSVQERAAIRAEVGKVAAKIQKLPGFPSSDKLSTDAEKLQQMLGRGRAAEDVTRVNQRPAQRQRSQTVVEKLTTAEALEERQGELWDCIDRKPGPYGGHVYRFKMKPEFYESEESLQEKLEEIIPAIEPGIPSEFDDYAEDVQNEMHILGFRKQNTGKEAFLELPDQTALQEGWKILRERIPGLPPLSIRSSEGIAGDFEFSEAYFTHDAMIAKGKEFLHDLKIHVEPLLVGMISCAKSGENYDKGRLKFLNQFFNLYQTILKAKSAIINKDPANSTLISLADQLKCVERMFGVMIDETSAGIHTFGFLKNIPNQIRTLRDVAVLDSDDNEKSSPVENMRSVAIDDTDEELQKLFGNEFDRNRFLQFLDELEKL